ncbi:threonine/serine dehydratase [Neolewinella lacunae]|uniref:Threonine/serine dehydratase n=1 Tax=Neolewinella lacunae TaxID=1517758 RepID=A0A923PR35_9BACT|nr:threonine/serine dehydratase [Neolewinella lacunae]MBC6996226.1 threonine/serine dehydratase [Neolewinella lacunae]MDN3634754.1 threonine/serine dehydratase [Neolewinella lacunae]
MPNSIDLLPLWEAPNQADLLLTHEAIQPFIHRTPVLENASLNAMSGAKLLFKCENFQKIGAFKMRGAASAALRLSPPEREKGLATHSSGNHAQAVALTAQILGVPAYIVMPHDAPRVKVAAVEGYGATITYCENTPQDRQRTLDAVVAKTGAAFIHPFNDYGVIAGQATAAMELIADTKAVLDVVMAPVGGGGLLSGTALATRYFSLQAETWGAEPRNVDDAARSLASGQIESNVSNQTVADGLRTNLGDKTFAIIHKRVPRILVVSEREIIAAMRHVWERMKIIIEPSCAVPLAAVLRYPELFAGKTVGIILTGGNVDVDALPF